jgi:pimeloyl-ACP methyl ester carboxylesterase
VTINWYEVEARAGGSLHVAEVEGDEPGVLFEAGSPGNNAGWVPVIDEVRSGARLVAYTRAGLQKFLEGDPEWPAQSPVRTLTDLAGLLEHLHLKQPIAVAHSFGGLVVAAFAALNPGAFRALVLLDPTPLDFLPVAERAARELGWAFYEDNAAWHTLAADALRPGSLDHLPVVLVRPSQREDSPPDYPDWWTSWSSKTPNIWESAARDLEVVTVESSHNIPRQAPGDVAAIIDRLRVAEK